MPVSSEPDAFPLRGWSTLRVSGVDAASFLHGQFTNDLDSLPEGRAQMSAYCAPKGGVISNFLIWKEKDTFTILLPEEQSEAMARRLSMFRLRAEVEIEDCGDQHSYTGLIEHNCPALQVRIDGGGTEVGWPCGHRAMRITEASEASGPGDDERWRLLDIESGIPFVRQATNEKFVPQYLNLDALDAISFDKGCYPGQEVVARLHYLGNLKHRTYRLRFAPGTELAPADEIFPCGEETRACGHVVDAQVAPDDSVVALAVVRRETALSRELCALATDGPEAERLSLPYPLPGEAD